MKGLSIGLIAIVSVLFAGIPKSHTQTIASEFGRA